MNIMEMVTKKCEETKRETPVEVETIRDQTGRCGNYSVSGMSLTRNSTIGLVAYFVGFRFPRMFSLIKNECSEMKDDKTPS